MRQLSVLAFASGEKPGLECTSHPDLIASAGFHAAFHTGAVLAFAPDQVISVA